MCIKMSQLLIQQTLTSLQSTKIIYTRRKKRDIFHQVTQTIFLIPKSLYIHFDSFFLFFAVLGFILSCTYASTFGSLASLVKTVPNMLLKAFFDQHYPNAGFNFLTFSLFVLPVSIILLVISWLWLSFYWLPKEFE